MISTIAVGLFAVLAATPCASLKSVSLPNTTITMAEQVSAGTFTPPDQGEAARKQPAPAPVTVPAFCRVAAVLKPTSDSEIGMELWLPVNWNGKFQFVGGGGWAGIISYPALATALQEGYATASTDTGHKGGNANFGIDHPEKVVDFAYRAVHETAVKSKALIAAHYDRGPRFSYWNGCSTGGRQGLMSAIRYPEDFDAIVAGAPANYQTHLHAWDLNVSIPTLKDPSSFVSSAKAAMLNKAVVDACDANDGLKDGLLNDPRTCRFDPAILLCKAGDAPNCLTKPQLEAVRRMYAPAKTKSGEVIFPGKELGSEIEIRPGVVGWNLIAGGVTAPPDLPMGSFQIAYNDLKWDWRSFDLDRDVKIVDEKAGFINAISPDLSAFKARGGKLILWHGWNDTYISPANTINYYSGVLSKMGGRQDNWIRLFMAPGMGHCTGGPGPNQINFMAALERWREAGTAPDQITAYRVTSNRVDMTRPLCPYPQVAQHKGTGSTNDAANFVCKAP